MLEVATQAHPVLAQQSAKKDASDTCWNEFIDCQNMPSVRPKDSAVLAILAGAIVFDAGLVSPFCCAGGSLFAHGDAFCLIAARRGNT